jgi:hypothetical protein
MDGEGIAMWRPALVRTGSVVSVVAEFVNACPQVINDPVPPSRKIAALVRIE